MYLTLPCPRGVCSVTNCWTLKNHLVAVPNHLWMKKFAHNVLNILCAILKKNQLQQKRTLAFKHHTLIKL